MVEQIETALVSRHIVAMKGNGGEMTKTKDDGRKQGYPKAYREMFHRGPLEQRGSCGSGV